MQQQQQHACCNIVYSKPIFSQTNTKIWIKCPLDKFKSTREPLDVFSTWMNVQLYMLTNMRSPTMSYSQLPSQAASGHNYNPQFGNSHQIVYINGVVNLSKKSSFCIIGFGFKQTNNECYDHSLHNQSFIQEPRGYHNLSQCFIHGDTTSSAILGFCP